MIYNDIVSDFHFLFNFYTSALEHLNVFLVQGGITEEQMLKFMGANTSLSPLQAKDLLEVSAVSNTIFACIGASFFLCFIFVFKLLIAISG